MTFSKERSMQELQRFGGAMYTPVILFAFFGLTVAVSIIFSNTGLFGSLAEEGSLWYDFWYVVQQGAWTVFKQMPILFAIAVPIGFAKKEQARCAMEGFVIYMIFNYFISGLLSLHGSYFGVDYSQEAGAGTGLAMIANIKTLDMGLHCLHFGISPQSILRYGNSGLARHLQRTGLRRRRRLFGYAADSPSLLLYLAAHSARYRTVPVLPQDQRHLRCLGLYVL